MSPTPASELTSALASLSPGRALDLACGAGRHTQWLRERGWQVTSVDRLPEGDHIHADLEQGEFPIAPASWDLIVCWMYWQADLLPAIAQGVRKGGVVALAGKTSGRFATSLANYRAAFLGWEEIASGEDEVRAFFLARKV